MGLQDNIAALPAPLREPAARWCEQVGERLDRLSGVAVRRVLTAVACSEFAARISARDIDWFCESIGGLDAAPAIEPLSDWMAGIASQSADVTAAQARLRQFRNRFMLRVYWRDLHGIADLDESLSHLSMLADRSLEAATHFAVHTLDARYGRVRNAAGEEVPLVILGMGKLGGNELNFSSDIDLIFCYPEDGHSDGRKCISAQEYFARIARRVIALLDEVTTDGFVFRIDTRLRPFGDSGPPVVSFAALEGYLLQHGRDWERYAYVKARVVGVQPPSNVLDELYNELIQPFVYRRYLDFGVFESLREMQSMIATEVKRRDLADNVKLGPGGIREIEFIVQALQLLRGGSEPALQGQQLQRVVPKLISNRGLSEDAASRLLDAYRFLRRLENFIQAIRDQQTHDLPRSEADRARLCLAMGFAQWDDLTAVLRAHRESVCRQFEAIALQGDADAGADRTYFENLWDSGAGADFWRDAFGTHEAEEVDRLVNEIETFSAQRAVQQADATSQRRLRRLIPRLVAHVSQAKRPYPALRRCFAVIERVVRRSAYIALLNESNTALSRFVDLCERSQYIADQLARHPVLLDELLDPRTYSESVTRADLTDELAERVANEDDGESRMRLVAHFQRATMFRIAVADFNGNLPIMRVSDGLTWLAETVIEEALQVAWRGLTERHGVPDAGFGIVAYGKLGGLEMSYGSDLDIVFLHNSEDRHETDGDKPLDNAMFFSRLVRRLVHFLTTQTGSGELYEVDTRLRPEGRSGLLVTSVVGFEMYQEENAWTWEHQALLRARPIAGDAAVAREFERIRHETLTTRVRRDTLRDDVISMRARMRKELDRSDTEQFDLKHGKGGVGDIEFLVQYLVLREAAACPGVTEFSDNIRQLDALVAANTIDAETGTRLQDIYRGYRTHLHHLALDDRPALTGNEMFADERETVSASWARWLA